MEDLHMSQGSTSHDVNTQSQELLQGPLKHARTAALALALVPLAAVAASTSAQQETGCPASGGICGTVFYDTNGNGVQDAGDSVIKDAVVTITYTDTLGNPVEIVVATSDQG